MRLKRTLLGLLVLLFIAGCSGAAHQGGGPDGVAAGVVSGPVDIPVTIAKAMIDPFSVHIVASESGVSILSGALEGESCDSEEIIEASIPGGLNLTATTEDCKFEFPLSADVKGVIISLAVHTEEPSVYVKVAADGTATVFSASCEEAVLEESGDCAGCYPQCSFEEPEQVSFLCPTKEGLQMCQQSAVKPTRFILTGPASVNRGDCSTPFTVTTVDAAGTARNVTEDTEMALSGGSGFFYSDPDCHSQVTAPVMTTGMSQMMLYFKDNIAESLLLKVSGVLEAGSLPFTVNSGAPTKLALTGSAEINYGVCTLYHVTAQDSTGTASPVSSDTEIMLKGGGHGAFYAGSLCQTKNLITSVTISKDAFATQFYFKDYIMETVNLMADDAGSLNEGNLGVTVK